MKKIKEQFYNNFNPEFQDVLDYHPNWIIRWGVTIIVLLVIILIYISTFINEPEIIKSKFILSINPQQNKIFEDLNLNKNEYICKLSVGIMEKSKLKTKENIEIELNFINSLKYFLVSGKVDTMQYNPNSENYDVSVLILSGLTDSVKNEIVNKGKIEGTGKIIVEKMNLFDRIFSKYKSYNKF